MINQDFDKFVKYQEKEKTTYLGNGKRAKDMDEETNIPKGNNRQGRETDKDLK